MNEPSRGPLNPPRDHGAPASGSRPGLAQAGPRTGRIATPRGYTYRHASSADLVIEVPGVSHANRGALRGFANPSSDVRAARDAPEVGALERATTQPDGRPIRPLGFERIDRDQARGSCETELLNQARPSSSHQPRRPPGRRAHRRKTLSSQPRSEQRARGARPVVGSLSRKAQSSREPLEEDSKEQSSKLSVGHAPKSPERTAEVSNPRCARANAPRGNRRRMRMRR